jgi:hypothetical protein
MDIVEPVVRPTARVVVPEQGRRSAAGALDPLAEAERSSSAQPRLTTPPEPVDHVRAHSVRCYWDHVECRWRCSA